ncbi:MAG: acylneuraminate cytidylyltransferase family protein [Pirellulales bacterium]
MTKPLSTLGIIPARGGSKRLPRKNLLPLAGKPLVAWSIEAALHARLLSRVVVSSENAEVLAIAKDYDPRLPLPRPVELAGDKSLAIEFVKHALSTLEARGEGPFEAIVIVQPSSPLTLPEDIDATVELLAASGAESAVSVMQLDHAIHPVKLKILEGDRLLPYLEDERGRMADHELPTIYVRSGSVYATRREVIERGRILGDDCRGYVMPRERAIDINVLLDFQFAEFLLTRSTSR